ncbi:hypothetical protein HUK80_08565 [Flavobacterium sp. MAH-1]|uniref:Uncharacterized protein n=1 Tax=Flavobacterium agri TaxID=2743471 RepID=A0A7Y9C740_9FLAO|nr:hypothetical protein [Flavobacterium agri]NUY80943.1 hypothetical protein [Flavobacterium agri]NYA70967.1 hypothetical protein [Flavobacterium agri]
MKKILKAAGLGLLALSATFGVLLATGIIWRSPKFYSVKKEKSFAVPIMDMEAYDTLGGEHARPYVYQITSGKGSVCILGIEHTKDPNDAQIRLVNEKWQALDPDVALVEGRLGFLFSGLQNPVTEYGEGGQTVSLAKQNGIPFYTWEPKKEDEVKIILEKFPAKQVAAFYSLRPYLSNFRFGKPSDPDASLQQCIDSRTDVNGLRGAITKVSQVDSLWKKDYPKLKDWRDTSDEYGWPDGYLSDIFSMSNQVRDIHLCSAISELVKDGKKVFVTMGSSHAFRIEKTLKAELK